MGSPSKRAILVAWPGADWITLSRLLDQGLLPNAQFLIEHGTMAQTSGPSPEVPSALYTSVATGFRPDRHGILTSAECSERDGALRTPLATSRRKKALWNIFTECGMRSLVVNWPAGHPAEKINGISVSEDFFGVAGPFGFAGSAPPDSVHPTNISHELTGLRLHPTELTGDELLPFIPSLRQWDQQHDRRPLLIAAQLARTISVHAVTTSLLEREDWNFLAVSYDLLQSVFVKLIGQWPDLADRVLTDRDFARQVGESSYRFLDMMLGRLRELAGPEACVVLVSAQGFRISESHRPQTTRGFFCMSGPGVRSDHIFHGASLLDIAPTVLTMLGVRVGRAMDGKPLLGAFTMPPESVYTSSWENIPSQDSPPGIDANGVGGGTAITELERRGFVDPLAQVVATHSTIVARERALNLGLVHLDCGDTKRAIHLLEAFCKTQPRDRVGSISLCCAYLLDRAFDKCRHIVQSLPEEERIEPVFIAIESFLLAADGQRKQALFLLGQISPSSRNALELHLIGCAYLHLGKWAKAEDVFTQAANLHPEYWFARQARASALTKLGRLEEAASSLRESVAVDFANPESHALLGVVLTALGHHALALQAFHTSAAVVRR